MNLPDPLRRAARTFLQAFLPLVITGLVAAQKSGLDAAYLWALLSSAAMAGLIAVLSFAQNMVENSTGMGLLKPEAKVLKANNNRIPNEGSK